MMIYYADPTGAGSDSADGSAGFPFATIQHGVLQLAAGDILLLRAGTFSAGFGAYYNGAAHGTSFSNAVSVRAYPGETVIIQGTGALFGLATEIYPTHRSFYWILDGLIFDGSTSASNTDNLVGGLGADFVRLQNCEVKNGPHQGILPHGDFWEILNCTSHDNGTAGNSTADHGLYWTGQGLLVDGGDWHDNTGYGIQIYDVGSSIVSDNVVRYAKIRHNSQELVGGGGGGNGGIIVTSGNNNIVHNCLIYGNKSWGASISESGTSFSCAYYHNTIYGNDNGLLIGVHAHGAIVRNNIVYGNTHAQITNNSEDQGFGPPYEPVIDHNIQVDPSFVDSSTGDFRLQSGSAARGAGADLHSLGIAELEVDFLGNPRPDSGVCDAGACSFITGDGTPDHLDFIDQPADALTGASLGTVQVAIRDSSGFTCPAATSNVTLSKDGSATWGAIHSASSLTKAAVAGVATWTDLYIDTTAGVGSLHAADGALTAATSDPITISDVPPPPTGITYTGVHTAKSSSNGDDVTTNDLDTTGSKLLKVVIASEISSPTLTDSYGNTWTGQTARTLSGSFYEKGFFCANPLVGPGHTFTATATGHQPAIAVIGVPGVTISSPLDAQNGSGAHDSSLTPGSITPSASTNISIIGIVLATSLSGPPSIPGYVVTDFQNNIGGLAYGVALAYKIGVSSPENPTIIFPNSAYAAAEIVTFKAESSITSVTPSHAVQGATLSVDLVGAGASWSNGVTVADFGPGITTNSTTVHSANSLTANITLGGGAAIGARTVTVTTGGEVEMLAAAFVVTSTAVAIYQAILDKILKDIDFAAFPAWISLHDGPTGLNGANEVVGGSYTRCAAPETFWANPVLRSIRNSTTLRFTAMPTSTITYVGIWNAQSGGSFLFGFALGSPVALKAGKTPGFPPGKLVINLNSVGSVYLANALLKYIFKGVNFVSAAAYWSLHFGGKQDDGGSEVSGGSYVRQIATIADWETTGASLLGDTVFSLDYQAVVEWSGVPAVLITRLGLWDAVGGGHFLMWGPDHSLAVSAGQDVTIDGTTPGKLAATLRETP